MRSGRLKKSTTGIGCRRTTALPKRRGEAMIPTVASLTIPTLHQGSSKRGRLGGNNGREGKTRRVWPPGTAGSLGIGPCCRCSTHGLRRQPAGATDLGGAFLARAHLVRSGRDAGHDHALPADVRAARRDGEADARQRRRAVPGRSLEDGARRPQLRIHRARRRQVPQRRAGDRGGREVLLRALSRHFGGADEGAGEGRGDAGRAPRALRAEAALAGFPDLLQFRHRRGLDRAEEVRPAGRRGRVQEGAGRRRAVQASSPSRPAWNWCSKPSTVTGARCRR